MFFRWRPALSLADEKGKARAVLSLEKTGPMLALHDEKGKARATLGATETVLPDGKRILHPESSIRLYGPDTKMLWKAP